MSQLRHIEIFSAGCSACEDTVTLVNNIACPSCHIEVLDMHDANVAKRAKTLGITSVPAVVIDGKLASCCENRAPTEAELKEAGIGEAV